MSPHCAIYIEDSKAIILQDTMGVWFKMMHHNTKFGYSILKKFRGYPPDKHSTKLQTFAVTLTLKTAIFPQGIHVNRGSEVQTIQKQSYSDYRL